MKTYEIVKLSCVVALTIGLLELMFQVKKTLISFNATTQVALSQVPTITSSVKRTVDDLDATVLDVRRTVLIAGGTLNIVRDTMRDEQKSIKAAIDSSQATVVSSQALIKNSTDLVATTKDSLQHLTGSVDAALTPVPLLLEQTSQNLFLLEDSERELTPLIKDTADTMQHVSGITADTQTEIHRFVYPPPEPWYDKYIINPSKIVFHMLTIPLR